MTPKEFATRGRELLKSGKYDALFDLFDEVDPPRPKPGLVLHAPRKRDDWMLGWWNGLKLLDLESGVYLVPDNLRMKPARVVADDEVAVSRAVLSALTTELSAALESDVFDGWEAEDIATIKWALSEAER